MPIKCVFFDFDGVLRNWDHDMYGIEGKFGIPLEAVREIPKEEKTELIGGGGTQLAPSARTLTT